MRIYLLLIFAAIFLSFQTAYFAFNLQKKSTASSLDIQEIEGIKKEFELKVLPKYEIDLSTMFPSNLYAQLIQPINVFSRESTNTKAYFSKSCEVPFHKMSMLYVSKSEAWEDFRCLRTPKLPANFFDSPPLIHENGLSYAYLAYLSGRAPYSGLEWLRSNLNLFHVYELSELPAESLDTNFKILSGLSKKDLESLVKGESSLISDEWVFFRKRLDSNVSYKIYTKLSLDHFLKEKIYYIKPYQDGEKCFYRADRFCWEKDSNTLLSIFMQSSIIIFIGSIVILILIAVILYKKIKMQKFEEERKKHALRVLTHELRTPIANLMLLMERINKESDTVPVSVLEDFLKAEDEVYRLKRLAEKSTSYLQTHDDRSLIFLNYTFVSSMNDLMQDLISDYADKGVTLELPPEDQSFTLDIYWFGICFKNLVENALTHGKSPVVVKLEIGPDSLSLSVTDSGESPFLSLEELLSADRRKKSKTGLGLGMSIVQNIMKEMNGKLSYHANPTTFILFLRNKK